MQFLEIQRKSAEIYRKYGAIDDWTFGQDSLAGKYGCRSFLDDVSVEPDEALFFSLSLFKSADDHARIMALLDKDPEVGFLYDQVCEIIDLKRVIRGEFNRLV